MALSSVPCGAAHAASFVPLGDLPGGPPSSIAFAASGDGSVVVGGSRSELGSQAFYWTQATGMGELPELQGGLFDGRAYGISDNGAVITGRGDSQLGREAVLWRLYGGIEALGDFPDGEFYSIAYRASADGSVVVGVGTTAAGEQAFRWTQETGMVGLGDLPGGAFGSLAFDVSPDGATVVGYSKSLLGNEAFRWTAEAGMAGLGQVPGWELSTAYAVSANGNAVVGNVQPPGQFKLQAFRWSALAGFDLLGYLPGGQERSLARDISNDGLVIVGWSDSAEGALAFYWTPFNGIRSLKEVLENDYGLDLTGWRLTTGWGVSGDGTRIVGYGINPEGKGEAWLADLSDAPCQP